MGIIKAFTGATGGVMADQWLEMYYCDSIPQGILALRGQKRVSERSSNTKGNENVISDGSVIAVNEGQSAIAIEQGKVIGCYKEPGEHIFHGGSASIFSGGGMKGIGKDIFSRVGFGGDVAIHQFILYIDMKEQMGNPFRVSFPICISDDEIGLQLTATAHASGVFSFRVIDPMAFYQKIFRGANGTMRVSDVLPQLQAEFATAMMEASAKVFAGSLKIADLPAKTEKLAGAVSDCMTAKWVGLRGFTVVSTALDSLNVTDAEKRTIQNIERAKPLRDPALAAATLTSAQADAMRDAAKNESLGGFVAVGGLYPNGRFSSPQPTVNPVSNVTSQPTPQPVPNVTTAPTVQRLPNVTTPPKAPKLPNVATAAQKLWYCKNCKKYITSKFCPDCGAKQEE